MIGKDALGVGTLPGAVVGLVAALAVAIGGLRLAAGHLAAHLPETLLALSPRR